MVLERRIDQHHKKLYDVFQNHIFLSVLHEVIDRQNAYRKDDASHY